LITSKSNAQVKEIRELKQAKYRQARGAYFIQGIRLVEEALLKSPKVLKVAYSPKLEETERGTQLLCAARRVMAKAQWLYVSDEVMATLSDTPSHQGILAVMPMEEYAWEDLFQRPGMILLLHELQDPGNLGTIFRVAEAGGAAGLVLSAGAIDPYNPKVVRASMGSILRLPFLADQKMDEAIRALRARGYRVFAAHREGDTSFWKVDFSRPTAILLGQEGGGIPPDLLDLADDRLWIPMNPPVESLNVAMAAGLILYEALRQKRDCSETG